VLGLFGGGTGQTAGNTFTPNKTTGSTPTTVAPAVPDVTDRDVFTPRNPFQPVFLPAEPTAATSTAAPADTDPDTLTLQQITEENGVRKGVFSIGEASYTVAAGEQLGTTPWQAVSIGSSSAIMMYGDTQITLTVGQGVMTK
jgi:hypothetical protein